MKKVISVRFKENGKSYYFDPAGADIKTGEYVIVETARGIECGEVVQGVQHRLLAREELVALLPAGHPLACQSRVCLADLEDQPLVDFPAGTGARRQTDEAFTAAGVRHRVQFEVGSVMLVEKFVQRGLALGLVAAPIARGFKGVVALPVSDAPVRHVYAIWSNSPSPAAKAFLQVLSASTLPKSRSGAALGKTLSGWWSAHSQTPATRGHHGAPASRGIPENWHAPFRANAVTVGCRPWRACHHAS